MRTMQSGAETIENSAKGDSQKFDRYFWIQGK